MRVTPVTKEVADAGGGTEPFKAGDYDFMVYKAEETRSQKGNEMLKLELHVYSRDGDKRTVFDYILSSDSAQWKARHLMESIGLARRYDQGIIEPREIEGKPGRCKIRVEPAKEQWPAKNVIVDYLGPQSTPRARQPEQASAGSKDLDDEIPF